MSSFKLAENLGNKIFQSHLKSEKNSIIFRIEKKMDKTRLTGLEEKSFSHRYNLAY